MITLKKASQQAQNITDKSLPSLSALRNWASIGCIQRPISYHSKGRGGRVGQYNDSLPIQIAIIPEMKEDGFTLKEISEVSNILFDKLSSLNDFQFKSEDFFKKTKKKIINDLISQNDFSTQKKYYKDGSIQMHLFEEENFSQLIKIKKTINIAEKYIDVWREKELKLNKLNNKNRKVE